MVASSARPLDNWYKMFYKKADTGNTTESEPKSNYTRSKHTKQETMLHNPGCPEVRGVGCSYTVACSNGGITSKAMRQE